jgi:hypothetical protein
MGKVIKMSDKLRQKQQQTSQKINSLGVRYVANTLMRPSVWSLGNADDKSDRIHRETSEILRQDEGDDDDV